MLIAALAACGTARAADVYAVRFDARSPLQPGGCIDAVWQDDLIFHNSGSSAAVVKLKSVSNGHQQVDPTELVVPPGRTVSAVGKTNWWPVEFPPLWLVRLDVPEGVTVQDRAEVFSALCPPGLYQSPDPDLGAFQLPVGRGLTPAGSEKVFLGADLGAEQTVSNVGVYNGGEAVANAVVEMRSGCDDSLLDSRSISIPPNTLVQINGIGTSVTGCQGGDPSLPTPTWVRYVTVTVDQPSFSYVVNRIGEGETRDCPAIFYGSTLPD